MHAYLVSLWPHGLYMYYNVETIHNIVAVFLYQICSSSHASGPDL